MTELDLSKLGGSDVVAILGLSNYSKPWEVAARIRGEKKDEQKAFNAGAGHLLEAHVAEWYADSRQIALTQLESQTGDWWRATPDAEATDGRSRWGVEIKAWDQVRRREFGDPGTDQVPVQLTVQCQWYMHWLGWSRMDAVVSFGTRTPEVFHLDADRALGDRIVRLARAFYQRAMSSDPLLIPAVQQPEPERTVFLTEDQVLPSCDLIARVRYLEKAKRIEKLAKQRADLAKAWFLDAAGNRPATFHTPDAYVSVYESRYGMSVRLTKKRRKR